MFPCLFLVLLDLSRAPREEFAVSRAAANNKTLGNEASVFQSSHRSKWDKDDFVVACKDVTSENDAVEPPVFHKGEKAKVRQVDDGAALIQAPGSKPMWIGQADFDDLVLDEADCGSTPTLDDSEGEEEDEIPEIPEDLEGDNGDVVTATGHSLPRAHVCKDTVADNEVDHGPQKTIAKGATGTFMAMEEGSLCIDFGELNSGEKCLWITKRDVDAGNLRRPDSDICTAYEVGQLVRVCGKGLVKDHSNVELGRGDVGSVTLAREGAACVDWGANAGCVEIFEKDFPKLQAIVDCPEGEEHDLERCCVPKWRSTPAPTEVVTTTTQRPPTPLEELRGKGIMIGNFIELCGFKPGSKNNGLLGNVVEGENAKSPLKVRLSVDIKGKPTLVWIPWVNVCKVQVPFWVSDGAWAGKLFQHRRSFRIKGQDNYHYTARMFSASNGQAIDFARSSGSGFHLTLHNDFVRCVNKDKCPEYVLDPQGTGSWRLIDAAEKGDNNAPVSAKFTFQRYSDKHIAACEGDGIKKEDNPKKEHCRQMWSAHEGTFANSDGTSILYFAYAESTDVAPEPGGMFNYGFKKPLYQKFTFYKLKPGTIDHNNKNTYYPRMFQKLGGISERNDREGHNAIPEAAVKVATLCSPDTSPVGKLRMNQNLVVEPNEDAALLTIFSIVVTTSARKDKFKNYDERATPSGACGSCGTMVVNKQKKCWGSS